MEGLALPSHYLMHYTEEKIQPPPNPCIPPPLLQIFYVSWSTFILLHIFNPNRSPF